MEGYDLLMGVPLVFLLTGGFTYAFLREPLGHDGANIAATIVGIAAVLWKFFG